MTLWILIILSFVEGFTEFLPVSSTGHLILTSALLGINEEGFIKSFNIIIQFGAILSVLVVYWKDFLSWNKIFYLKLLIGFLPAAIIGLIVKKKIDILLGSVQVVIISLIIGGIILLWTDYFFKKTHKKHSLMDLSWKGALFIGIIQCLAFIPGVSRAAATIIGGLVVGLNRKDATEFSFFLAVPTLSGAAFIKTIPLIKILQMDQILWLFFGIFLSFLFALVAIKFFIHLVSRYGFFYFGIYRVFIGILLLFLL